MSERFEIIDYPLAKGDERGWVIRPIYNRLSDFRECCQDEGLGDVKNLHVVSIAPGVVRGEHYHKRQLEFLVVMGGLVEVVWQHPEEESPHRRVVDSKEPVLLRVPNEVIHSIKNVGDSTVFVICYAKAESLSGKDSYKVKGFHGE